MKAATVVVFIAGAVLLCRDARADDTHDDETHDTVVAVEGVVANESPHVAWVGSAAPGRLVGVASSSSWSPSIGFGLDGELHIAGNDTLGFIWRYGGIHYSTSTDGLDSTTSAGEAPVVIRNGPLSVFELDLPLLGGLGGEIFVSKELKLAAELTWGWAYAWSAATIRTADGAVTQAMMQNDSVYVRMGADACLRMGTLAWTCVTASATYYNDDWGSASVGLKVEM